MKAVPLNRYLVFVGVAAVGCAVDLTTKSWIFAKLGPPDPMVRRIHWIWDGVFGFQTSLNEGALFGMGQGQVPLLVILSCAAMIALLAWLFVAGAARDKLLNFALACVSAGILGNLYDRLGLPGLVWSDPTVVGIHRLGEPVHAVRDWIVVMIGSWQWPNFNVADSLLVCGAAMLAWHAWRSSDQPKPV